MLHNLFLAGLIALCVVRTTRYQFMMAYGVDPGENLCFGVLILSL